MLLDLLGDVGGCTCCWIYWAMSLFRKLSDLLGDVGGCTCCWIYWGDVVVSFVVGFIGAMSLFRLLLDLLGDAGVSAFRHDTPAKPRVE